MGHVAPHGSSGGGGLAGIVLTGGNRPSGTVFHGTACEGVGLVSTKMPSRWDEDCGIFASC